MNNPRWSPLIREYPYLQALDEKSTIALYQRMARAEELPGHFYRPGSPIGIIGYIKPPFRQPDGHGKNAPDYILTIDDGCTCPDADPDDGRAPFGWCKHRLALWLRCRGNKALASAHMKEAILRAHVDRLAINGAKAEA